MGKNTSISLGNHFEDFIREEVNSGRYGSVSEVIRSALRLLGREEKKERELIKALGVGENSGFVEITGEAEVTEEELTPSYTGKTGYIYEIKWISRHKPPKPVKARGSAGGGKSYVGVELMTTICPAFQ